jgi:hypothetical protein
MARNGAASALEKQVTKMSGTRPGVRFARPVVRRAPNARRFRVSKPFDGRNLGMSITLHQKVID